jgi:transketolase
MNKLSLDRGIDKTEMRNAYCEALIDAAKVDERIVTIDCDLSNSMGTRKFINTYPKRAFNIGIQESNGVGMAAGLSATGLIPFFHSFAVFSSRRIFDQAFISCAYAGLNVKIIGGDAGVSAAKNGGTHMAFEDMGIMRNIPTITVIDVTDTVMMRKLIPLLVKRYGVDYLRMPRKYVHRVYDEESSFEIGKANILREGTDVTIIACGLEVHEALVAADMLKAEGIEARIVDMFTIKPIDKECIIESAKRTGAIVTAENHNVINGLGSAVAEVLCEEMPIPLERVGVLDEFGEVGSQEYLMERFGLTAESIYKKAKKVILRKQII